MIRKIRVEGYQSLKDVEVDLGHFTVILGESNVGKSALLRAIKALVENQTGLDDFLTLGMKACRVELTIDDADAMRGIVWEKRKNGTQYHLHIGDSIQKLGKGVGVPAEVTDALRMERIEFSPGIKFAPNFHDQFSTPFLLEETGGRVAKMLGEMSGVNLLYRATAEANVRAKRNQQVVSDLKVSLDKLRLQLAGYEFIRVKGPKLQEAKKSLQLVEKDAALLTRMLQVSTEWSNWKSTSYDAHQQQDKLTPILTSAKPLEEATEAISDTKRMKDVLLAWLKAAVLSRDYRLAKEKLLKLSTISFAPIEEQADEVFMMRKARDAWNEAYHAQDFAHNFVGELTAEVEVAKNRMTDLMTKLKVCPYCGHTLHKEGETCACCK